MEKYRDADAKRRGGSGGLQECGKFEEKGIRLQFWKRPKAAIAGAFDRPAMTCPLLPPAGYGPRQEQKADSLNGHIARSPELGLGVPVNHTLYTLVKSVH